MPDCPNYCNDLNAMHEAEKVLSERQCVDYVDTLNSIQAYATADDTIEEVPFYPCEHMWFHATALQRAEAFLRTLGLWLEDTPSDTSERDTSVPDAVSGDCGKEGGK